MENRQYKVALWLAFFTIFYNIIEGLVSMWFGFQDETLTLFGFGVDSFIEVMSGIGIAVMIVRIGQNPDSPKSNLRNKSIKNNGHRILSVIGWIVDRHYFQPDQPSQARNNFLGRCHIVDFDCRYDLADECKDESWETTQLRADHIR